MELRKILVVRLSALGDVLFTLPAVESLLDRHPEVAVDWLVEDKAEGLLDLYGRLRRRIVSPRRALARAGAHPLAAGRALARALGELRRERYDLVLDFQGNLKSLVHRHLARARRRVGFDRRASKELSHLGLDRRVEVAPALHRVDKALALVRAAFPDVPPEPVAPRLEVPPESAAFARAALQELGLGGGRPFVVVHPGTSAFGAFKRWPADRFALLADRLVEAHDADVLVTFGPGEAELAGRVAAWARSPRVRPSVPTRTLADLAALLQRATLFVGSDSAPLHLAAFLGTPVVALFGPKDPQVYGPRFAPARVVRTYLPCSPCTRRSCPDVLCMEEIGVRQVFEACRALWEERPRVPA